MMLEATFHLGTFFKFHWVVSSYAVRFINWQWWAFRLIYLWQNIVGWSSRRSFGISIKFLCSMVIRMLFQFQLSPSDEFVRYVYCLAFFVTLILQIFMISYFGEKILTASNILTFQAYSTSWYMASVKYRKTLLVLMLQLHRDSKISAGKIFPINLNLFSSVIII